MELLVVLGIVGVLLGVSLGALQRNVPRRDLARNELLDKLRRARLFAMSEQAPSEVRLSRETEDAWPFVTALGRRTVGLWHLEGADLEGFPKAGSGTGAAEAESGVLGRAIALSGQEVSYLDFGTHPSFESEHGLACELFVEVDGPARRTLVEKRGVLAVTGDEQGFVSASVAVRTQATGELAVTQHHVTSSRPLLLERRFAKVAVSFDGLALRLYGDDVLLGEAVLVRAAPVAANPQAPVVVGAYDRPFAGVVDEFRWAVYTAEVSEPLAEMSVLGPATLVRFAPGGELDPRFHTSPVDLGLKSSGGAELWVTVGILGDAN